MDDPTINTIYSRRITRFFSGQPINSGVLERIVEAARWAPSAGNRRLQKFVVVTDPIAINHIRIMAPGIDGLPPAMIVVCTDWQKAGRMGVSVDHPSVYIDVGAAMQNLLLAAHALDVGAGPATSFSRAAVQELLDLPRWLSPDLIVNLGYPDEKPRGGNIRPAKPLSWRDLTFWNRYPGSDE